MLEKKIIQVDESLIRRKSAVRRRNLEEQSYFEVLFRLNSSHHQRSAELGKTAALSMLNFLGCTDAIIQKLRETIPPGESRIYSGITNYSLHLSALYNRLGLLSALGTEPVRDRLTMNIDPSNYSLVLPELIRYNLRLLEENKRKNPVLLQEYFFYKVIEATFRNGQKPSSTLFNSLIGSCTISIKNGAEHSFEGYTDLEELVEKAARNDENSSSSQENKSSATKFSKGRPPVDIRFADIAGYHDLKAYFKDLREILLKNNVYQRAGVPMPTGFLLYGPPGTGKTTLVYAFANECGWPFLELNIQNALDKYVGESEKKIARFLQQKGILLLDEFDSLGRKKEEVRQENSYALNITNVIATELNKYDPERILFAITNNLDMIDTKIKSRRLGNVILVDYPSQSDLVEIIFHKLHRVEEKSDGYTYTTIDVPRVAAEMIAAAGRYNQVKENESAVGLSRVGFSGADIEYVVHETIRTRAREMLQGKAMVVPATEDYLRSVQQFDFTARQR